MRSNTCTYMTDVGGRTEMPYTNRSIPVELSHREAIPLY